MAVMHTRWGLAVEQILEQYPHLDLTRIYAALAYYYANWDRIEQEIAEETREYDAAVAEIEERERSEGRAKA